MSFNNTTILSEQEFDNTVDKFLTHCRTTLTVKGKEYRRNNDCLHNFNKGVDKTGNSRESVIRGMRLKHDISVDDIINDVNEGKIVKEEVIFEKYGDIFNYILLEIASIQDKNKKLNESF